MQSDTFQLTGNQDSTLFAIANLCPAEGSYATLKARGLLHALGYTDVFDDSPCYDTSSQQLTRLVNSNEQMILSPNPANEFVLVQSNINSVISEIFVIDNLGRNYLHTKTENLNSYFIDLSELQSGIYQILAITKDKNKLSGRLIINK